MKRRFSPVFWLATGLFVGLLAGALVPAAYSLLPGYDYNQVVAMAGETPITRGDLAERTIFRYGPSLLDYDMHGEAIVKEMARRMGFSAGDEEVNQRVTQYKALLQQYADLPALFGSKMNLDALPEWLVQDQFRTALLAEKVMGVQQMSKDEMDKKMDDMYLHEMDSFAKPAMVNLTMIACADENDAWRAHKRLRAGEDPKIVSQQASSYDGVKKNQGVLGWVARSQMNQQLADAIFNVRKGQGLKKGEFTDVLTYDWVKNVDFRDPTNRDKQMTETNYIILYVNDIRPQQMVAKKDVLPVLDLLVRQAEVAKREADWYKKYAPTVPWKRVANLANPNAPLVDGLRTPISEKAPDQK